MTLPWFHPREPQFRHVELRRYYDYERDVLARNSTPLDLVKNSTLKLQEIWRFYYGPALSVALIALPQVWRRRRRIRLLLLAGGLTLILTLIETGSAPHYASAATACFLAVLMLCLRRLTARPRGAQLAILLPAILAGDPSGPYWARRGWPPVHTTGELSVLVLRETRQTR